MWLIRVAVAVVFAGLIVGDLCAEETDVNNLAAYYGFGDMEVIKLDWGIQNLRIADFNGDKRNDIAVVNNAKAKIEVLIQKEAVGPAEKEVAVDPEDVDINLLTPPTRFDRQAVAVSQKVYSFVCGDLNSDGMMDLAFYGEPKGLYIILQKASEAEAGEMRRLKWRTRRKIKIDDGLLTPDVLVCADLNNDGADDLALAGRDAVYLILQRADGSLAEPVKYPTTALTRGIEVGDMNGDGINDLVLIANDREEPMHVRFGLETGQLGPQERFFIEKPLALQLYDVNRTGGDEILTVDGGSGRLICYEYASEREADADWPVLFYPLASGEGSTKRDLAVGDFDGDGLTDVVISEPGAAELILYRQRAGLGLSEPVKFPAFADIESLSSADIDGDGKSEVVVLSVKEKVIGRAEFEEDRLSFPKPLEIVGEPLAMDVGDVDHDGSIDCVYVSKDANDIRALRVIYDVGQADEVEERLANAGEDDAGRPALELKELASNPDGLRVLDVDQDGLEDILIFVKYELPLLIRQAQRREFALVDSPGAQMSLIKDALLRSIAVADVDGRAGKELLVAQQNFARSLVFAGGEGWSIIDQYNARGTEDRILAVAAFDIYDEGLDFRPAILLLDGGKGQLQILQAGEDKTYRFERELDVGKWNAADHLKMLFASLTGSQSRSIFLFDSEKFALITPPTGGAVRRVEEKFSYETKIKDGAYGNLQGGDINSDGRADIIMVEYKRNHIEILALDGELKPVPAMRFKIFEEKGYRDTKQRGKSGVEPRELRIADVTGDGRDDLVTIIHDRIIIYPQD